MTQWISLAHSNTKWREIHFRTFKWFPDHFKLEFKCFHNPQKFTLNFGCLELKIWRCSQSALIWVRPSDSLWSFRSIPGYGFRTPPYDRGPMLYRLCIDPRASLSLILLYRMFYRNQRPAARLIVKNADTVDVYLIFLLWQKRPFLGRYLIGE